jgi:hypothetical protein
MFKPLHSVFNLKQIVTFIAALWLQVTLIVIICCIASPQRPPDQFETPHATAANSV